MTTPARLRLLRLSHGRDLPMPSKATADSAGLDLCAAVGDDLPIPPGQVRLVPCGFAMALDPGFEAQVRPRSGLASRHLVAPVNAPGTIDADYRGEVCVPLVNHGPTTFVVTRGMRVAQMVIQRLPAVDVIEVEEAADLGVTGRGGGGFGSTGA